MGTDPKFGFGDRSAPNTAIGDRPLLWTLRMGRDPRRSLMGNLRTGTDPDGALWDIGQLFTAAGSELLECWTCWPVGLPLLGNLRMGTDPDEPCGLLVNYLKQQVQRTARSWPFHFNRLAPLS
jgi:hypothetical protein